MLKFLFDQQVYAPGSTVRGKLLVNLNKKLHTEHIKVSVHGNALLKNWSDDPFRSDNSHSETYLDMAFYLWRKDSSVKDDSLCSGSYEFPFEFPLPPDIPSTFKDVKGFVEYTCKAWIPSSGMFGRDYGLVATIPVQRRIILPATSLHDPQYDEREVAGGLFKCSGRIKLSVELPRSGYLLGEYVPLSGHIMNTSTSSVRLCAYLIQHVVYTNPRCLQANRQAHYSRSSAAIGQFARSLRMQNIPWTCMFRIPDNLPPSGATEGCQYFAISYTLKVFMVGSGTAKSASITFDITVGNGLVIPQTESAQLTLNNEAQRYEQTVDFNDTAEDQSIPVDPFYLGGGIGVDPFMATGSYSESTVFLSPQPRRVSVPDTDAGTDTDITMQPPSYHELFPAPTEGSHNLELQN